MATAKLVHHVVPVGNAGRYLGNCMTEQEACGWRLASVSHVRTNLILRMLHGAVCIDGALNSALLSFRVCVLGLKIEIGFAVSQIYHWLSVR
jgi:hypothetical protein